METGSLLIGGAILVPLAGAGLSVPASWVLMRLYGRAVLAAMRGRVASAAPLEPPAAAPVPPRLPAEPLALEIVEQASDREWSDAREPVLRRALRGPWVTALVYGVAGLGHAAFTSIVWLQATGTELLPVRTLVMVWVHAWPIVLATNLITTATGREQGRNVAVYVAGLAGLYLVGQGSLLEMPVLWAVKVGVPTVLLLAFLHPRVRAVGPLVLVFTATAVAGIQLALALVATEPGMRTLAEIALALEADAVESVLAVALLAFALFGILGWLALSWIRRRYEGKQMSDQSLTMDAVWLLFTVYLAIDLLFHGIGWAVAGLGGFAVYKALATVGFAVARRLDSWGPNHRLLLLRVFGSPARSERLMARVGSRWRYCGSIQLITGTDLATANLEPHEFLDFVRGKLAHRYIRDAAGLERHLGELDTRPDFDGRFRVNEFFCYDDTWRLTLARLVASSDAVLVDLRGFTPANQGVVHELQELVRLVPLRRVVLVADGATDLALVRAVLEQAWATLPALSPNRDLSPARVTVCRLARDDTRGARFLLARLAQAVAPGERTAAAELAPA